MITLKSKTMCSKEDESLSLIHSKHTKKKRQYDFYGEKKPREVIEIRFGFVDGRKLFNQHAVRHTS